MTVICIKDGVLAVDSGLHLAGGVMGGTVQKWARIAEAHGGGRGAATGDAAKSLRLLRAMGGRTKASGRVVKNTPERRAKAANLRAVRMLRQSGF